MSNIIVAKPSHAAALFAIQRDAVRSACELFYPPEVRAAWQKGRTIDGMRRAIVDGNIYVLLDGSELRGFVEFSAEELVALFVDPDHFRRGFGAALLEFATRRIETRPAFLKSTLNAVPFYASHGWRSVRTEAFRRHEHDFYVVHMELK